MGIWGWPCRAGASSSFGSSSTAEEVTQGIDASHLTAIVTGATNGIGRETARVLALRGAKVIMSSRTLESGLKVKESLLEQNPRANLHVMEMDLGSLDSVRSFARAFNSSQEHLNILINNAGIMSCPFQLSRDGIELQFATNHLGHFLLTNLLLDKMKTTAKKMGEQGRVVIVSSTAHRISDGPCFNLDKINDQSRYKPFGAYTHSKLANILHANVLSMQLQNAMSLLVKPFLKNIHQGAATTCYLALHPNLKDVTGEYFVDCKESTPSRKSRDKDLGKKLWDFSEGLVKEREKTT